ncbi:unnamed protein product [Caenorhabditis bovis]|uniref:BHLH domain-containing protein n=1 Tax=Caenorhabditis bovis TaxID=2654633 RepID=A0A8S1EEY5_9PELO|nr:unnamed protein product [Caenorhabditis bovis]
MFSKPEEMYMYNALRKSENNENCRKRRHSEFSDDDESSPKSQSPSIDDDRRAHHNELERKRRDHIKDHFMILKDSIPLLDGEKSSRALILKRAVEYITTMQSRLDENQKNIEELRKRNELLEEKLKDCTQSVSPPMHSFIANTPQITLSPVSFPMTQIPTAPILLANSSASVLSQINPVQLNNLIASSQEAIMALTQTLVGKVEPIRQEVFPTTTQILNLPYQTDRQMSVRF